jgi:pilus assembly protein CpaB
LELTPEQANIILLAKDKGELNLTYTPDGQGDGGVALADDDRAFLEEILGLSPPPEPKKPILTEHYRGAGRGVMAFNDDGTLWSGSGGNGGDGYGYGQFGRQAPLQFGGHEPTSGWGGGAGGGGGDGGTAGGVYRGIDNRSPAPQSGNNANPNAGQSGVMRLIPSPGAPQGPAPAAGDRAAPVNGI